MGPFTLVLVPSSRECKLSPRSQYSKQSSIWDWEFEKKSGNITGEFALLLPTVGCQEGEMRMEQIVSKVLTISLLGRAAVYAILQPRMTFIELQLNVKPWGVCST